MIISFQNFNFLRAILDKLRHYIINLTNICKNILKDYIFDKQIIEKFKIAMKKSKEEINKLKDKENKNYNKKGEKQIDCCDFNIENDSNKNLFYFYKNNEEKQDDDNNIKIENENINEKLLKKLNLGENFVSQKLNRISKALETNKSIKEKPIKKGIQTFKEKQTKITLGSSGPMALINSPLMTKMLKYIKKDYNQKIVSLRTSERYLGDNI